MIHYDILVIGGGPAAITVAKTINGKQRVGIIRPEDHSMVYCAMPYAILRVLGAQFLSGEPVTDKVDVMTLAIQNELTVANLAELSYSAQPYQSFFPASNLMVAAAEEILSKVN